MAQSNPGTPAGSHDGSRNRKVQKKKLDLTIRNTLEFVVSVYFTGSLPLIMHGFVALFEAPADWLWEPAEAWLIVVVTCGAAFADAWRERRVSDNALNSFAALFGALGTFFGALSYAILTIRPKAAIEISAILTAAVW